MKGTVKWFSEDKGYGFIFDETGEDRFFGVRDIKGATLPGNGDVVNFEPGMGKKGPRASAVCITQQSTDSNDQRVSCHACGKKMVPRIVTGRKVIGHGFEAKHSICPFCSAQHRDFKGKDDAILITILAIAIFAFIIRVAFAPLFG